MTITIKTHCMQDAELLLALIEKSARHLFVTHGVRRKDSRNGKNGKPATIVFSIDPYIWFDIMDPAVWEFVRRTGKSVGCHHQVLSTLLEDL